MENNLQKSGLKCPVCGQGAVFFINKNSFNIFRCKNCDLLFVNPLPERRIIEEVYSQDYFYGAQKSFGYVDYDKDKEAMRKTFMHYLDLIERFYPQKGRLLDVGAATGFFLELAKKRGWEVYGIEISPYAAQKAREKRLDVKTGTLEQDLFQGHFFDIITLWDVVEHFSDPEIMFKKISQLLAPNGLAVINTPDAGSMLAKVFGRHWHSLIPPEHLILFNKNNLSNFLMRLNFKVLWTGKIGKRFTLQYMFKILSNNTKFFLCKWCSVFFQNCFLGKLSIPFNLRDNFIIIAKNVGSNK